jgi:hypothetical protein
VVKVGHQNQNDDGAKRKRQTTRVGFPYRALVSRERVRGITGTKHSRNPTANIPVASSRLVIDFQAT